MMVQKKKVFRCSFVFNYVFLVLATVAKNTFVKYIKLVYQFTYKFTYQFVYK